MLSSIKAYVMAALAVAVGVLAALWQYSRASHANDKLAGEKASREVENKANDAMIDGLEKEDEIKNNNTIDRSKFLDD